MSAFLRKCGRETRSSESAVLPSITRARIRRTALSPLSTFLAVSLGIVVHCYKKERPKEGYPPLPPPEVERDKPTRHNFEFFPRESAPVFYDVSSSVLLIAA